MMSCLGRVIELGVKHTFPKFSRGSCCPSVLDARLMAEDGRCVMQHCCQTSRRPVFGGGLLRHILVRGYQNAQCSSWSSLDRDVPPVSIPRNSAPVHENHSLYDVMSRMFNTYTKLVFVGMHPTFLCLWLVLPMSVLRLSLGAAELA